MWKRNILLLAHSVALGVPRKPISRLYKGLGQVKDLLKVVGLLSNFCRLPGSKTAKAATNKLPPYFPPCMGNI